MKKSLLQVVFLLVIAASFGVFAAGENCFVTDRASCQSSGYVIMGLSSATNAHGQLANETGYGSVLCCNFAGSNTCNGNNTVLKISSSTNAHAEIPNGTNYLNNVCYEQLSCISTTLNCSNTLYTLPTVSLTSGSSAHIGPTGEYSINICCTSPNFGPAESSFWSVDGETQVSSVETVPGTTKVKMVLRNSQLSQGAIANFSIYENDFLLDDFIRTISAAADANGTAVAEWTITLDDLSKTTNDYSEFYFNVNDRTSNYLSLSILNVSVCNNLVICSDYESQSLCEVDSCGKSTGSAPSSVNCQDPFTDCFCGWNQGESKCGFNFALTDPETNITLGTCVFSESTTDDCSDGFLSYSWTVSWTGLAGDLPASCVSGSKVVECPAQVQLPFFGVYNAFLAVITIGLIYYFLVVRESRQGKSKKK
jgi:hypothetical protein